MRKPDKYAYILYTVNKIYGGINMSDLAAINCGMRQLPWFPPVLCAVRVLHSLVRSSASFGKANVRSRAHSFPVLLFCGHFRLLILLFPSIPAVGTEPALVDIH